MASLLKFVFQVFLFAHLLHSSTAWVRRSRVKKTNAKTGDVRLIDGATENEGTVLIFKTYDWGTICDDGWDMNEAKIVCRQLGLGEPRNVLHRNYFQTTGYNQMYLDDLECIGNETHLGECPRHFNWGRHDCHSISEIAGVRCHIKPKMVFRYPSWNPLGVEHQSVKELKRMQERNFTITAFPAANSSFGDYAVVTVQNKSGSICPDDFTLVEGNVFCREQGRGFASKLFEVDFMPPTVPRRHTLRVGLCYGNETSLGDCKSYASPNGVQCESESTVSVLCTNVLPDLEPDLPTVQSSAYLARLPLWLLSCSMEERCLAQSAYSAVEKLSAHSWQYMERFLLRFTSIIKNEGTGDFVPLDPIHQWEWHACHLHYHSMKMFAKYEIVDNQKYILAAGHKASFCLEDNECKDMNSAKYRCSTTVNNYGTQGISPGCKDIYLHNYDCQWVDITDLPRGHYQFRLIVNPEFKVSELNFFNNAIVCDMYHITTAAFLRNCKFMHPHDI